MTNTETCNTDAVGRAILFIDNPASVVAWADVATVERLSTMRENLLCAASVLTAELDGRADVVCAHLVNGIDVEVGGIGGNRDG